MSLAWWAFWGSMAGISYLYFGYPALVLLRAKLRPRPVRRGNACPRVSIIVAAYNEEALIERKILNTRALDYPASRLELLIVSDGSTDRTVEIARCYRNGRLRVLAARRRGKAYALNRGAAAAHGDVLVFTDANTVLKPDALRRLVAGFCDPEVGGVCGNKQYLPAGRGDATGRGEGAYWGFDTWLKTMESAGGSVFAADGALYAVRRSLFMPIADPAQADDMAISMRVVLQHRRLVFEPGAVVLEDAPPDAAREFRRKVRVTNHSLRALLNLGPALWSSGFYSVQLLSHKLLRHFTPVLLLAQLAATAALAPDYAPLRALALLQLGLAGLAAAGYALRSHPLGHCRLIALPAYACGVNLAALAGILWTLRGRQLQLWTPRGGDVPPPAPLSRWTLHFRQR